MIRRDLRRQRALLAVGLLSLLPALAAAQAPAAPDPQAVRAAFIARTNDGTFRGLTAAWRDGDSLRMASAGTSGDGGAPMSPDLRLPLGEVAEVFTDALLASLVVRGELSLDDLAQRFMPAGIRLPTRGGRAITLGDLAFHRAGLPGQGTAVGRTPAERLARAATGAALRWDIGSRYAYSQLGLDLLGAALANHLHLPLERAIDERILRPLGLSDIAVGTAGAHAGLDAIGHTPDGTPRTPAPPEGQWHASVSRLAQFAAAAGDTVRGPLASTFAFMLRTRSLGADPSLPVALGWRVLRLDGRDIYWHDALDVPGFSAYVAFDPALRALAAVLSNTERPVDAIAGQILLGRVPVIAAEPPRRAVRAASPPPPRSRPRRRR